MTHPDVLVYIQSVKSYLEKNSEAREYFIGDNSEESLELQNQESDTEDEIDDSDDNKELKRKLKEASKIKKPKKKRALSLSFCNKK